MKSAALIFLTALAGGLLGLLLLTTRVKPVSQTPLAPTPLRSEQPKTIGFLPYWLIDKAQPTYQTINELSYFSLSIDSDGTIKRQNNSKEEEPGWTALNHNQTLKGILVSAKSAHTNLSLTVMTGDENTIKSLISDPVTNARNMVNDVGPLMQQWGFTDLNLDVESIKNASDQDRDKFSKFVAELKKNLTSQNLGTLTVDVQAISLFEPYLTDIITIGKAADYILIMAYDFHYPGSLLAGSVSPIGGAGTTRVFDISTTLARAISDVPREKIVFGLPLYGYEWNTLENLPGSPAIPGTGVLASDSRIDTLIESCTKCTTGVDSVAKEPYVIFPEGTYFHQIYYQNPDSIEARLNLARNSGVAGVAFWALGYEASGDLNPLRAYLTPKS